jgi:hypothetical protein
MLSIHILRFMTDAAFQAIMVAHQWLEAAKSWWAVLWAHW